MVKLLEIIIIGQISKLRQFGKIPVELPLHTCTEIAVKFSVDYMPTFQQIENLIQSSLQTITSAPENPLKKLTFAKFFEKAYKSYAVTIFLVFAALVLQHPFFDLTQGHFLKEEYQFHKGNPYVQNLSLLMCLSPKLKSIFSIVAVLATIQYEFKNKAVAEIPEKLEIAATNPLVWYLIVKIDYGNLFVVNKLIVFGIKFEVSGETNFVNDSPAKPRRQTRPCQCVSR